MASGVQSIKPDDDLSTAARLMQKLDTGCLPVVTGGRVIGLLTDRDLVIHGLTQDPAPASLTVAAIMSRDPIFCMVDDPVTAAAQLMRDNQLHRLPVLDASRRLVGMISLGDVCIHLPVNQAGELIQAVSRPSRPHVRGVS